RSIPKTGSYASMNDIYVLNVGLSGFERLTTEDLARGIIIGMICVSAPREDPAGPLTSDFCAVKAVNSTRAQLLDDSGRVVLDNLRMTVSRGGRDPLAGRRRGPDDQETPLSGLLSRPPTQHRRVHWTRLLISTDNWGGTCRDRRPFPYHDIHQDLSDREPGRAAQVPIFHLQINIGLRATFFLVLPLIAGYRSNSVDPLT